jgi:hypothetical protein
MWSGRLASPSRCRGPFAFKGNARISRRWLATSSIMPANGRATRLQSASRRSPGAISRSAVFFASPPTTMGQDLPPGGARRRCRGASASMRRSPDRGLGLSIVADLASLYGGILSLEDSPKGGLRADLRLPNGMRSTDYPANICDAMRLATARPITIKAPCYG